MDKVLVDTLKADLKSAKTDEETRHAMTLSMIAMIDCQYSTGERVKRMAAEIERGKTFASGARWVVWLLWLFASSGGFALVYILVKISQGVAK